MQKEREGCSSYMKSTFQYRLIHDLSSPDPSLEGKLNIVVVQTFDDEVSRLVPWFALLSLVPTFKKVTSFNIGGGLTIFFASVICPQ